MDIPITEIMDAPEFGPGRAALTLCESPQGLLLAGIHGDMDGELSFDVFVTDEYGEIEFTFRVDTTPAELKELVREWVGSESNLVVAPCYPAMVARRHGEEITVVGGWDCETTIEWSLDMQSYCPSPVQGKARPRM